MQLSFAVHTDDVMASLAGKCLESLKCDVEWLTGPDPRATRGKIPLFSSPKGTFPSRFLRNETPFQKQERKLSAQGIFVPAWARNEDPKIALNRRALDAKQIEMLKQYFEDPSAFETLDPKELQKLESLAFSFKEAVRGISGIKVVEKNVPASLGFGAIRGTKIG